ncbi:hypothetical protein DFQ26_008369 [Actinomortierella ambigua]|nr:hypothetical protein DFQ26_008369 [Actinomortierella ambigua]
MWCNNCCLLFPLRGGAMWLASLSLVINAIGGVLLFLWGGYWFGSTSALIFAGFSVLQAVMAALALLSLCNESYMLTRIYVYIEWIVVFIGTVRIGFMAYRLQANKDWIVSLCRGGVNEKGYSPMGTAAAFYCNTNIDTFIMFFIVGLVVDYVIQLYLYFVVWRYYVRMRLYPFSKASVVSYEQGLYDA